MSAATARLMTASDLLRMRDDGWRYELVRGALVRRPLASAIAGVTAARLAVRMGDFIERHQLGISGTSAGFVLGSPPDTVRAPNLWFVAVERVPPTGIPDSYWPGAPDLAVEVLSPWDRFTAVLDKVRDFLGTGTRLMWVLEPGSRSAAMFRPDERPVLVPEMGALDGGDVLPGFSVALQEVLPKRGAEALNQTYDV